MRKAATSEERVTLYRTSPCGACGADIGDGCYSMGGVRRAVKTHPRRIKAALAALYTSISDHEEMCPCNACALAKRLQS